MDADTLARLRRPFDRGVIKQRIGPGGRQLTYAPITAYIERLLEAFGGAFSIEITSRERLEDEVIVEVRIEAGGTTKMGLGGAPITRRRDNGKPVSIAHDFMASEAVAVKRAARGFGIGLELYEDADDAGTDLADSVTPQAKPSPVPVAITGGRITAAQITKIRELLSESGDDVTTFKAGVREAHGVTLEHLDKKAGSRLIEDLLARARRHRTNGHGVGARRAQ